MTSTIDFTGKIVGKRYKLIQKLGSGGFGDVYLGFDIFNLSERMAVKVERGRGAHSPLMYETTVYSRLEGVAGFPEMNWCLRDSEQGHCMMGVELLGPSLEELFKQCSKKFSLKTVLLLGDQMIQRIRSLHEKFFVHRDIKPANFLMGIDANKHQLYMIDFGISKQYFDEKSQKHIPRRQTGKLVGSPKFTSLNSHLGQERSRRDDLQSICYLLIYFLKGTLPWIGVKGATRKQTYNKIREIKLSTSVEELCNGVPFEFIRILKYCAKLEFEQKPSYSVFRLLLQVRAKKENIEFDNVFDWTQSQEVESKEK